MRPIFRIITVLITAAAITHVIFETASKSFCTTDAECCVAYADCSNANE